jgi:hypothetical protein
VVAVAVAVLILPLAVTEAEQVAQRFLLGLLAALPAEPDYRGQLEITWEIIEAKGG